MPNGEAVLPAGGREAAGVGRAGRWAGVEMPVSLTIVAAVSFRQMTAMIAIINRRD